MATLQRLSMRVNENVAVKTRLDSFSFWLINHLQYSIYILELFQRIPLSVLVQTPMT